MSEWMKARLAVEPSAAVPVPDGERVREYERLKKRFYLAAYANPVDEGAETALDAYILPLLQSAADKAALIDWYANSVRARPAAQYRCRLCEDTQWVCEQHPDRPWSGMNLTPSACPDGCAGPGVPCPLCHPQAQPAALPVDDHRFRGRLTNLMDTIKACDRQVDAEGLCSCARAVGNALKLAMHHGDDTVAALSRTAAESDEWRSRYIALKAQQDALRAAVESLVAQWGAVAVSYEADEFDRQAQTLAPAYEQCADQLRAALAQPAAPQDADERIKPDEWYLAAQQEALRAALADMEDKS